MYTASAVDIYYDHQCIATHKRSTRQYAYTTNKDHLASTHKFMTELSAERLLGWAAGIGTHVHEYVEKVFEQRQHPEQAYRTCLGILGYAKKVGDERLLRACKRGLDYGTYNYSTIRNILEKGLDALSPEEADGTLGIIPDHDNIRGGEHYGNTDSPTKNEDKE